MLRRYLVAALPLLMAAQGPPPPPWAEARGDLDGDGRPERAHLERDGSLVIDAGDGHELARVALPEARRIERAEVRFVGVDEHVVVVHARAQLGRGQASEAVVAAGGKPLFVGRTGPRGDGDRIDRLRVDDGGVVRWQTTPGFRRCDGDDMLFPERWDFASGRFRGVTVEPPAGKPLRATTTAPAGVSGPPLGLFHFVASSTDATGTRAADQLAAPRELDDGKPATVWHAGAGAAARGAWVTARTVGSGARVKAVEIVGGKEAPRSVLLLLGPSSDQRFSVEVGPGARWVALPEATATQCLSVVVAEPGARDNTLAEVAIYTDVDGAGGIDRLVTTVAELGPDADAAAHLLEARGLEAARAVAAALPASHGQGRRRLLQVLAAIGSDESAPALGKALETAEPEDRATLVTALAKAGAAGVREAARVYGDGSQTAEARADAATVLGMRGDDATAAAALVAGAGRGEPAVRVATMKALAAVYARSPERVEAALREGGDDARVGDLARALSLIGARVRPEGAAALAAAWDGARSFELKLRLERAMAAVHDRALEAPLTAAAREAEPVLRAAAVEAVAAQAQAGSFGGDNVLRAGLSDGDPGVRRAAIAGVAMLKDGASLTAGVLGRDGWPLVRRAAAEGLATSCKSDAGARAALTRAVSGDGGKSLAGADASEEVRRTALASLGRCGELPLGTFTAVLVEKRQPMSVRELAAVFVARHGGAEAAGALAKTLDDVLGDPNADERSAGLAVACTRALARTGDTSRPVLEALGQAANEPMSAPVRAAAMETIGKLCPDGAAVALRKGADDPDPSVKRAAGSALARCKK